MAANGQNDPRLGPVVVLPPVVIRFEFRCQPRVEDREAAAGGAEAVPQGDLAEGRG